VVRDSQSSALHSASIFTLPFCVLTRSSMSLGMYFLLGLLLHALVAWAARDETNRKRRDGFVFVHMADPQLGMLNQFGDKEDMTKEQDMAKQLAEMVPKIVPKPSFLFLGGDMQNEWPNTGTQNGNAALAGRQREAVKNLLQPVLDEGIRMTCTPGNHDVGDEPQNSNLNNYSNWWSTFCTPVQLPLWKKHKFSTAARFAVHNVLFLQIDSQLYWTNTTKLKDARTNQTNWLSRQVNQEMPENIERIVMLTHIPPFMHQFDEAHGWANWHEDYRTGTADKGNVLAILETASKPIHWVCGHFHTNVENNEPDMHKIRVTSSAGTTMWWNAASSADVLTDGIMTAQDAAGVAGMNVGEAFCKRIAFGIWDTTKVPPCAISDWTDDGPKGMRMRPIKERSGIRIFHVPGTDRRPPTDAWLTLAQLQKIAKQKNDKLPIDSLGLG